MDSVPKTALGPLHWWLVIGALTFLWSTSPLKPDIKIKWTANHPFAGTISTMLRSSSTSRGVRGRPQAKRHLKRLRSANRKGHPHLRERLGADHGRQHRQLRARPDPGNGMRPPRPQPRAPRGMRLPRRHARQEAVVRRARQQVLPTPRFANNSSSTTTLGQRTPRASGNPDSLRLATARRMNSTRQHRSRLCLRRHCPLPGANRRRRSPPLGSPRLVSRRTSNGA